MAINFWGLHMKANQQYSFQTDYEYQITQAALDPSTGNDSPVQIMVATANGITYLMGTLQKDLTLQMPLSLIFDSGEEVTFIINGTSDVYLTGTRDPSDLTEKKVPEPAIEVPEPPVEVPEPAIAFRDLPLDNSDNEDDSDYSQDSYLSSDEMNFSLYSRCSGDEYVVGLDDDDSGTDNDYNPDHSIEERKEDMELSVAERESGDEEVVRNANERLSNNIEESEEENDGTEVSLKKLNKLNINESDWASSEYKVEEMDSPVNKNKKIIKKSLANGVITIDTTVGKGCGVKDNDKIKITFVGRLKSSRKVFETVTDADKFTLVVGKGEVLKGLDIGIKGMKVGGVRRIICSSKMAYGAAGLPPLIPPKSVLMFEVKLKKIY